jgi:outer membrane protein, multidrug efflux system
MRWLDQGGIPPSMRRAQHLAFGAILMLGACAAVPDYQSPDMTLPARFSRNVAAPASPTTADRLWWQDFQDPVLNNLVAATLAENPTLAVARARLAEAEAQAEGAGASGILGDGRVETASNSNALDTGEVGLSALFDLNGERRAGKRAARARADAAAAAGIDTRRLLVADLAATYVDLRYYQTRLSQRQQDLASRQRSLRNITTRTETGVGTELDVLQAGAVLAETQVDIPRLEALIIRQRNRLSTLAGHTVGDLGIDLGYPGVQPLPHAAPDLGVPADLLRLRPDIRQAERAYAAAIASMTAAEAARYPTLSLNGVIRAPLSGGGSTNSLAAGLTLPIFSQGALAAEARAANARADAALAQWRSAVLSAVEEVETALAALQGAQASARAAQKAVSLNTRALALTREQLESGGDVTTLDLLDRERDLSNARGLLAQSCQDVAREFIALRTALAVGLGVEAVQESAGQGASSAAAP